MFIIDPAQPVGPQVANVQQVCFALQAMLDGDGWKELEKYLLREEEVALAAMRNVPSGEAALRLCTSVAVLRTVRNFPREVITSGAQTLSNLANENRSQVP